jgi:hypothetical protein
VSRKKAIKPIWWKNSYFWIGGLLIVVAIIGLIAGEGLIRDPGQRREGGLVLIYLGGAAVMFVNGLLSHRQSLTHWKEEHGG